MVKHSKITRVKYTMLGKLKCHCLSPNHLESSGAWIFLGARGYGEIGSWKG